MTRKNANDVAKILADVMKKNDLTLSDVNRGMVVLTNIAHFFEWNKKPVKPIKEGASCSIDKHKAQLTLDVSAIECST